MDDTPDYQNYTLEQLYDVTRHINREKFPERYALVAQEILIKEKCISEGTTSINEQFVLNEQIFLGLKMVGAYIIGAILAPIILFWPLRMYVEWKMGAGADIAGGVALGGLLIFVSFAFGALGGYIMWRKNRDWPK